MASVKQLQAVARDRVGKGAARAVRRQGRVPAVIYGAGAAPTPIALDFNEARRLIFAGHFLTTVFEIEVDGTKTRAMIGKVTSGDCNSCHSTAGLNGAPGRILVP